MKTDFKFKDGAPFFTTERLSPHKEKTPEGYLLCRDVPISRVGTFDYAGSDVGFADVPVVHVSRPEDELFNPDTMASFEGKPLVIGHDTFADPDTWRRISIGHVQNVRRDGDLLMADLLVQDARGIDLIERGALDEISCGYDAGFVRDGEDSGHQTGIVGNHVALVKRGRCGSVCSIGDGAMTEKTSLKSLLRRLFKDGDEESFNEALDSVTVNPAGETAGKTGDEEEVPQAPTVDERLAALEKAVQDLTKTIAELQKPVADEDDPESEEPVAEDTAEQADPEDAEGEELGADESRDLISDAEDLCPGIQKPKADKIPVKDAEDLMRRAMRGACASRFGDADTLSGKALSIAFKASADAARASRNPRFVAGRKFGDAAEPNRIEAIQAEVDAFWGKSK